MGKWGGIYRERPQTEQGEEGKPKTRDSENNTQDGYVTENIGQSQILFKQKSWE